jgi:hypothetical protein
MSWDVHAEKLRQLAWHQAQQFSRRQEIAAVAITGSVARGQTWEGSDVDLWGFSHKHEDGFEDGIVDGVYWEIDIKPLSWLRVDIDEQTWLHPPPLTDNDRISHVEALWGCHIVLDGEGALLRLKHAVDSRVADRHWLNRRADLYLSYGRGCLDALRYASPLRAIISARDIATQYGIAAYWMRSGQLLTSMMRVPERLAHAPELHRLYSAIFGLGGQPALETLLDAYHHLPEAIRRETQQDVELEVLPAAHQGAYDGATRYLRQQLSGRFNTEAVRPALALEEDLDAQKARVLQYTTELLERCRR